MSKEIEEILEEFDKLFTIHSFRKKGEYGTHIESHAKWQGIHLDAPQYQSKIKEFFANRLAEQSKAHQKEMEELVGEILEEKIMIDNFSEAVLKCDIKRIAQKHGINIK